MLVVNLYAGPGAGKSTTAAATFAELKRLDVNCELVTEYAKDAAWEHRTKVFQDQLYLLGKQHFRLFRLLGEVDVVVTDAPLLLGVVYNRLYAKLNTFEPLAHEAHCRFNNLNYYLMRTKAYNPKGRNQTEHEAKQVDHLTRNMLHDLKVPYREVSYHNAVGTIIDDVLMQLRSPLPQADGGLDERVEG